MVLSLAANLLGKGIQSGLAAGLTRRAAVGGIAGAVLGGDEGLVKGAALGAIAPGFGAISKGLGMSSAKLATTGLPVLGSGKFGRRLIGAGAFGAAGMGVHSATHDPNVRELYESRFGVGPMTDMKINAIEGLGTAAQAAGFVTGGATLFGLGPVNIAAKGLRPLYKGTELFNKGFDAAGRGLGAAGRGIAALPGAPGAIAKSVRAGKRNFSAGYRGLDEAPDFLFGGMGQMSGRFDPFSRAYGIGVATQTARQAGINAFKTLRGAAGTLRRSTATLDDATWTGPRRVGLRAQGFMAGIKGKGVENIIRGWGASGRGAWGNFKGKAGAPRVGAARRRVTGAVRPDLEMGYGFGLKARGAVINAGIKGIEMGQSVTAHAQRWTHSVMRGGSSAMSSMLGSTGGAIVGAPGAALGAGKALAGPFIRHPNLTAAGGGVAAGMMLGGTNAARRKRGKNFPEGNIRAMRSAPRGGIHPALNFSTQGLTLRTHNRRKRRVLD